MDILGILYMYYALIKLFVLITEHCIFHRMFLLCSILSAADGLLDEIMFFGCLSDSHVDINDPLLVSFLSFRMLFSLKNTLTNKPRAHIV